MLMASKGREMKRGKAILHNLCREIHRYHVVL